MKKRITITIIFLTMAFAFPLSNNGNLNFSVSEANIKTGGASIHNESLFRHSTEPGVATSQISNASAQPGVDSKSLPVTLILFGTGLVGLVGIGRSKKRI